MMDSYEAVEKRFNTEEKDRLETKALAARIDAQKWREQADHLAEALRLFARRPIANGTVRGVVEDALQAYDEAVAGEG